MSDANKSLLTLALAVWTKCYNYETTETLQANPSPFSLLKPKQYTTYYLTYSVNSCRKVLILKVTNVNTCFAIKKLFNKIINNYLYFQLKITNKTTHFL